MTTQNIIIAGDIGATKTDIGLFFFGEDSWKIIRQSSYVSADFCCLEEIIRDFLAGCESQPQLGCFGVAGPVISGRVKVTNLPWEMTEAGLAGVSGCQQVTLINDLAATAAGIALLTPADFVVLNEGHGEDHGNRAVIAPGTGLGEAFMVRHGRRYQVVASEGGHADFAPASSREIALLQALRQKFDHVSYDHLCCGRGIPLLYDFLQQTCRVTESAALADQLRNSQDPVPVIIHNALGGDGENSLCRQTLDLFVDILAAEAGNLALKVMATGGLYIGGGIPPRILPALQSPRFLRTFCRKGRMSGLMENIPVKVIMNPQTALLGAANWLFQAIKGDRQTTKNQAVAEYKYRPLKKQLKKSFRALSESVADEMLPSRSSVEQFLQEAGMMVTYPGFGDAYYDAFIAGCENLEKAFAAASLPQFKEALGVLNGIKKKCHEQARSR